MVCQDKDKIDYAGRRVKSGPLFRLVQRKRWMQMNLTILANTSSGVEGGAFLISEGRSAAFRQFLIRGASCALPSVFCNEGTG
jgi:hypothetical protein